MIKLQLFCLIVATIICSCMGRHRTELPDPVTYFFGKETPLTSINITWDHGVNSDKQLKNALEGEKMMLEADIIMGEFNGSKIQVPIMAHPPTETSDLSFEKFLSTFIKAANDEEKMIKKGIKLDFKQMEAVEPALEILHHYRRDIDFPVWLNADVLQGPVNSNKKPINGMKFIDLAQKLFPQATLSLGWTTKYGKDNSSSENGTTTTADITSGHYTPDMVTEMIDLITQYPGLRPKPTFAVRAGLAAESTESLLNLATFGTLTLWSHENDDVDMEELQKLIDAFGSSNVYADVPFNIHGGAISPQIPTLPPSFSNDTTSQPGNNTDDHDHDHDNVPDGASVFSNNLHMILLLTSLLVIKQYFC